MDDHVAVVRRVVIIDSSRTALAIIEGAFDNIDTFVVIGVARDTASGLDLVRRTIPDAAMIGVDGLEAGGLDLLRSMNAWQQTCKIVLSDRAADDIIVASQLEVAGASLCLSKRVISVESRSFFDKVHHACDELVASTRGWLAPLDISSGDGVRTGTRTPRAPVHFGYPVPVDEDQRCMALERRGLADGIRERQFDLITRYMAEAAGFLSVCSRALITTRSGSSRLSVMSDKACRKRRRSITTRLLATGSSSCLTLRKIRGSPPTLWL